MFVSEDFFALQCNLWKITKDLRPHLLKLTAVCYLYQRRFFLLTFSELPPHRGLRTLRPFLR